MTLSYEIAERRDSEYICLRAGFFCLESLSAKRPFIPSSSRLHAVINSSFVGSRASGGGTTEGSS